MELRQYAVLLRKWLWLLAVGAVLPAGWGVRGVWDYLRHPPPPVYQAKARLLISGASVPEVRDENRNNYNAFYALERQAETVARQLTRSSVREEVMERLGLKRWTAAVSVTPIEDTPLLTLTVQDRDPERAMRIANLLPEVFSRQNAEAQRQRFAPAKENFSQQLAEVRGNIDTTAAALQALQAQAGSDPAQLERLHNELNQNQTTYSLLLRGYQDLRLAEAQILPSLGLDEPASLPGSPAPSRPPWREVLFYALLGTVLAGAVALVIEYLADTLKTPEEIQETLGLRVLGAIPRIRNHGAEKEILCATQPQSPLSEAYRVLRTHVRFGSDGVSPRTILITSPGPGEGKSTTVANLGAILAQAGLAVIVVDANLRQPTLDQWFQLPNHSGLSNLLTSPAADLEEPLQATGIENLRVLTSGPLPPNPSELLGSERMEGLIKNLEEKAEVLLFDTPSCLAVTDAAVLARQVDGVLLVIGAGQTRRQAAVRAKESLNALGANLLGVVWTHPTQAVLERYYVSSLLPRK
jgi:non-specific protein-tyrosine kinase